MAEATFRLMNSSTRDLTPDLIREFRDLTASPTEREVNASRLKMLREKAAAQQLISFSWAKARVDERWVRVNGQHSSLVLDELVASGALPAGLKVHVDEYEVSDLDGLALLFRQFDDRKSGRSSGDVAGAYQNIIPELQDVARPIGKLAIDGVSWYRKKIEKLPTPGGDSQYTLFHEFALHDFIKWLHTLFSIKTPELKSVAVVAAMYACYDSHPDEARKFWETVARGGDQYDDNAASSVLDTWLKDIKKGDIENVTPGQVYQGCIFAYNAARRGQALKSIKYDFKQMQEPIAQAA